MMTLVLGASGATGQLVVEQLIRSGRRVKIVIRPSSKIPDHWHNHEQLVIVRGCIDEITVSEMRELINDCDSAVCCLGHNLTWQGIFGKPRRLVTDAIKSLCQSIVLNADQSPVKIVLMNSAGNSNRDLTEPISVGQRIVIGLLRLLLPPHPDNEDAADFLRTNIGGRNKHIEWVVVRPDSLFNEEAVSEYTIHQSPTRSAIFDPGQTSRINVAHFMATLISNEQLWERWQGQMPVIYNDEQLGKSDLEVDH